MKRLNLKLFIWLVASVLVLTVGVHFLHGFQVSRNANSLLNAAEREKKAGNLSLALKNYDQYLYHRDDAKAYAEMATIAAEIAERPGTSKNEVFDAFKRLEEALVRHPDLTDVRRRLVDFMMSPKMGRYNVARDHIEQLKAAGVKDPDLDVKLARCKFASGKKVDFDAACVLVQKLTGFDSSTNEFNSKKAQSPHEIDAYVMLARVFATDRDDKDLAAHVLDEMVARNPKSPKAFYERGLFKHSIGQSAEGETDLKTSLKLKGDDLSAALALTDVLMDLKKNEEAEALLDNTIKVHPTSETAYRARAIVALRQRDADTALAVVKQGLEKAPKGESLHLWNTLADIQVMKSDMAGLKETLAAMEKQKHSAQFIDFFRALILLNDHKWREAKDSFERLRQHFVGRPQFLSRIEMSLGQCYENLGAPDQMREAFAAALKSDPNLMPAKIGYSRALRNLGRVGESEAPLKEGLEAMAKDNQESPGIVKQMISISIAEQMRKPAKEREWAKVRAIVEHAIKGKGLTDVEKDVLMAEVESLQTHYDKASKMLVAAQAKFPKDITVWQARVNLSVRQQEKIEVTEKLLQEAEAEVGDVVTIRQMRAAWLGRLGDEEAKIQLAKLEQGLEKYKEPERIAVLTDIGLNYYRRKDFESCKRVWREIAKLRTDDVKVYQTLFEISLESGSEPDMKEALDKISGIVGENDALTRYCKAARTLWQVKTRKVGEQELRAALDSLEIAMKQRTSWHELTRLRGQIHEQQKDYDNAIADYRLSLQQGPANEQTIQRMVMLLYQQNKYTEALVELNNLKGDGGSKKFNRIRTDLLDRGGDKEEAIAAAERDANEDSADPMNFMWLGQIYDRNGRSQDAENALRAAVEKGPQLPQTWLMLISHFVATKNKAAARATIREAVKKLPENEATLALAQAYEMVDDTIEAEKYFKKAVDEKNGDLGAVRTLATFYMRIEDQKNAQRYIDELLSKVTPETTHSDPVVWARRAMSQILATRGNFQDLKKALTLIEDNKVDGKYSMEDRMLVATVLATRTEPEMRQRAIAMLQEISVERPLSVDELYKLAELYERGGEWLKARDQLISLMANASDRPALVAEFVRMLIKHDELDRADQWLRKLEELQPNAASTVELKARVLAKRGELKPAQELIESQLPSENDPNRVTRLGQIAALFEEIEQYDLSAKYLRDFIVERPKAILVLAAFLGRHGDVEESFKLCTEARRTQDIALIVQVALNTLRSRPNEVGKKHFEQVEKWITRGLTDEPDSINLRLQLAELKDLRGQNDEVIKIYRDLMADSKLDERQKAIVANNLAFIKAINSKQPDEAKESVAMIEDAVKVLGPSSDLLDTRAVCYLYAGDVKKAIADLELATADMPSAIKMYHMGLAQYRDGNTGASLRAMEQSKALGLNPALLPLAEQPVYRQLLKDLNIK